MNLPSVLLFLIASENLLVVVVSQTSFLDTLIGPFRIVKNAMNLFYEEGTKNPRQSRRLRENKKLQEIVNDSTPFPCFTNNFRSEDVPRSVHKLKPGDVDVIGAIGDSLTAGFGLLSTGLHDILSEDRGLSFSIGGQGTWREYLTIPNILKVFNPNLIGYSLKHSLTTQRESQFNVAEGGAVSENMPYMAKVLVKRIKSDIRVNITRDWKLINILIGANDFCSDMCYFSKPEVVLERHKEDMLKVLRTFRDNLPRTFVNLIPPPDVDVLTKFTNLPPPCFIAHRFECPCMIGEQHRKSRNLYRRIIKLWQKLDVEIANYNEFDREDFTVVAQPIFINYKISTTDAGFPDYSYFAEDCFHFSQKGTAQVANVLWNSILEPVGRKHAAANDVFSEFSCPSNKFPFLFTRRNSDVPN